MKNAFFVPVLTALVVLSGCSNKDYDISEGRLKTEITLFEDEISIPLGSIGPITVMSTLMNSSIGAIFADYIEEDPTDGSLLMKGESDLYSVNVYSMESSVPDPSVPFTWSPGDQSSDAGGIVSLMSWVGLQALEQHVDIQATNPLNQTVALKADASVTCYDDTYTSTYNSSVPLDFNINRRQPEPYIIYSLDLPSTATDPVSFISLDDLTMEMPANPSDKLTDDTVSDVFTFSSLYQCKIGIKESFTLEQSTILEDLALPIGQFNLHKCEISFTLENTLPLSVTIDSLAVIKPAETEGAEEVEDVSITQDITIQGGSLEHPGLTPVKLVVEAREGTIPDINRLYIAFKINAQSGCGGVAISTKQGLTIQSSSAKISGGITIPEK